jgi:hypothetical protein
MTKNPNCGSFSQPPICLSVCYGLDMKHPLKGPCVEGLIPLVDPIIERQVDPEGSDAING